MYVNVKLLYTAQGQGTRPGRQNLKRYTAPSLLSPSLLEIHSWPHIMLTPQSAAERTTFSQCRGASSASEH